MRDSGLPRRIVIVADIAVDELWAVEPAIRDLTLSCGLRSCWSTPIRSIQGVTLGTFAMYYSTSRLPGPGQLQFADRVSRTAATLIELKRADENKARLTAIVNSSDDAVIGVDLDGKVVTWSPSAVRLYGYTPDEIVGKPLEVIVPQRLLEDFRGRVDAMLAGDSAPAFDTVRVHKDGHEVEVSIKHSPIQDEHGHIIAVSAIHRDIAERKALEKLQQDFLAMVTHELRNPLTTVKGVALILRRLREFDACVSSMKRPSRR